MTALADLADRPIWVAWRSVARGGKATKIPYSPISHNRAKADDPSTWGTFSQARSAVADPPYHGVGLQLVDLGDGLHLGGIDLDSCIEGPPDDPSFAPWALPVVNSLTTYTEVSPSLAGIKCFFLYRSDALPALREAMGTQWSRLWSRKPAGGSKASAIELHLGNRYFAVTGRSLASLPQTLRIVEPAILLGIINRAGPDFAGKPDPQPSPSSRANPTADSSFDWDQRYLARDPGFDAVAALAGPGYSGEERDSGIGALRQALPAPWALPARDSRYPRR